jgi:hypothetical protein
MHEHDSQVEQAVDVQADICALQRFQTSTRISMESMLQRNVGFVMTSGHDSIVEISVVIPLNKRYHENHCIVYIGRRNE